LFEPPRTPRIILRAIKESVLSSDKTQSGRRLRRRGYRFWLLNAFVACGVCYVSMWLFARIGGEWATRYDIPVPNSSEFVTVRNYVFGQYVEKRSLFISQATPKELREWFIQSGVPMTPILLDAERNIYMDQPDFFYETPLYHHYTLFQVIHLYSVYFTTGWLDDMVPHCQGVQVYRNNAAVGIEFPGYIVPEGYTAFMVSVCWPDVRY
jgi:hypothetical protein